MQELYELARLIEQKNRIERKITEIIGRLALIGHVGEYIAAKVFGISLVDSASNKGFDGYFTKGNLKRENGEY